MRSAVNQAHFLRLIWSSPIFGDAFPPEMATRMTAVLSQMESLQTLVVKTMEPALVEGLPRVPAGEVGKFVRRMVPKAVACYLSIAAGEITDLERLRSAMAIGVAFYACDLSVDAGDEAMRAAICLLSGREVNPAVFPEVSPWMIQARLTLLRRIEKEIELLHSLPDNTQQLLRDRIIEGSFYTEVRKRELNQRYGLGSSEDFWGDQNTNPSKIAETLLASAALEFIVCCLYIICCQHQPHLPNLSEVFDQPQIVEIVRRPCNAAIRIFDDLGDQLKDRKHYPGWAEFNLNIFNQPEPRLVQAFLCQAGFTDEALVQSLLNAFQSATEDNQAYIVQVFVNLLRDRFRSLPASLWEKYGVFLTLVKRGMEMGYVNYLSDIEESG